MKWSHAKNIMIALLLILNIFLFVSNYRLTNTTYTLSSSQEDNIRNVLANENIFLYTTLPKKFSPMRNIEMERRNIDDEAVVNHFFKNVDEVKKMNEGNKEIYYIKENEYVEIYRNGMVKYIFIFDNSNIEDSNHNESKNEDIQKISRQNSYDLLNEFIPRIYKGNRFYKAYFYNKENDEYIYLYYNTYKGIPIMNDYMQAKISNERMEVEVWGADIVGYTGNNKKIISVDEALYSFMKSNTLDEVYLMSVELGYYTINDNLNINDRIEVEPYYKITTKYNGIYYINAYTNVLYDQNLLEVNN